MDPSRSAELFALADAALHAGFDGASPPVGDVDVPPAAVFVTIEVDGELNGCIGTMAPEPLGAAVPRLAWEAAFTDPRLPPLEPWQHDGVTIKLSILSPMQPLDVSSVEDLVAALRPGIDGALLEDRGRRGTFLPAVWRSVSSPEEFVRRLLQKAGLRSWSATTRAWRYQAEELSAQTKDVAHHVGAADLGGADGSRDA